MTDLFSFGTETHDNEQARQIKRVIGKIGPKVLAFIQERGVHGTFHAKELHDYVGTHVAPASSDRILRELRLAGVIDYEVINRRQSFYRIVKLT
jgi:hypothetical protein